MQHQEELRQGAWAQIEPPRKELPLETVAEMGFKGHARMKLKVASLHQDQPMENIHPYHPLSVYIG